jgi:excisionase family DNA binding protein
LRPAPPTHRRQLSTKDEGQLSLPFLVEAEISAATATVDHAGIAEGEYDVRSSTQHSTRASCLPPVHATRKARASDPKPTQKTAKRNLSVDGDISPNAKLLVSRREAAVIVSLSLRSIDGLLASKQLPFRKIGTRTLIPLAALQKFARADHPERIAS